MTETILTALHAHRHNAPYRVFYRSGSRWSEALQTYDDGSAAFTAAAQYTRATITDNRGLVLAIIRTQE